MQLAAFVTVCPSFLPKMYHAKQNLRLAYHEPCLGPVCTNRCSRNNAASGHTQTQRLLTGCRLYNTRYAWCIVASKLTELLNPLLALLGSTVHQAPSAVCPVALTPFVFPCLPCFQDFPQSISVSLNCSCIVFCPPIATLPVFNSSLLESLVSID